MAAGITYSFDPAKAASNKALHGVDFADVAYFDWASALVIEDVRRDYGEKRYIALGILDERVHVMVFSPRADTVRLISLRKANKREVARYEKG